MILPGTEKILRFRSRKLPDFRGAAGQAAGYGAQAGADASRTTPGRTRPARPQLLSLAPRSPPRSRPGPDRPRPTRSRSARSTRRWPTPRRSASVTTSPRPVGQLRRPRRTPRRARLVRGLRGARDDARRRERHREEIARREQDLVRAAGGGDGGVGDGVRRDHADRVTRRLAAAGRRRGRTRRTRRDRQRPAPLEDRVAGRWCWPSFPTSPSSHRSASPRSERRSNRVSAPFGSGTRIPIFSDSGGTMNVRNAVTSIFGRDEDEAPAPDALTLLKTDHAEVKATLREGARRRNAGRAAPRHDRADPRRADRSHEDGRDDFYPALRRAGKAQEKDSVLEAFEEHAAAKDLIARSAAWSRATRRSRRR